MSEPFDFDAFISGTSLARRKVSAYRVDHRDEIERLTAEHDALPAEDDERESSGTAPRQEIAKHIADLRAEMEASRVTWTLRTLQPQEFKSLQDDEKDESEVVFDQIALQSRAPEDCKNPSLYADLPNLTADQWRSIAGVIGARQWGDLVESATALILSRVAVPDFSRSVSATLKPPTLSES